MTAKKLAMTIIVDRVDNLEYEIKVLEEVLAQKRVELEKLTYILMSEDEDED